MRLPTEDALHDLVLGHHEPAVAHVELPALAHETLELRAARFESIAGGNRKARGDFAYAGVRLLASQQPANELDTLTPPFLEDGREFEDPLAELCELRGAVMQRCLELLFEQIAQTCVIREIRPHAREEPFERVTVRHRRTPW